MDFEIKPFERLKFFPTKYVIPKKNQSLAIGQVRLPGVYTWGRKNHHPRNENWVEKKDSCSTTFQGVPNEAQSDCELKHRLKAQAVLEQRLWFLRNLPKTSFRRVRNEKLEDVFFWKDKGVTF